MKPIAQPALVDPADLLGLDAQLAAFDANVRALLAGRPANHVLISGARGTGKSSMVRAMLHRYADRGLRVVEVAGCDLVDLPDVVEAIDAMPGAWLIFSDDLSFNADDPAIRALKAVLDGSLAQPPEHVRVVATSNRRHLLPEYASENLEARMVDGELHPGETSEEKISLSDRFGLWLNVAPFDQARYLELVEHWRVRLGVAVANAEEFRRAAIAFSRRRATTSGRAAKQFVIDWSTRY